MKNNRIAIALGHNALGTTLPEQKKAAKEAAKAIVDFVQDDCEIVITHSNGPQVGVIHAAMSEFHKLYKNYTATPMSVCSAMSQGYIGYDLQQAIRSELMSRGIFRTVATILTQVTVDPYDDAFYQPTKIIGRVMTAEEAEEEEQKGHTLTEVEGGYRRIVAAPTPIEIVELDAVKALLNANEIVIAAGGGGIPVLQQGTRLQGASAVIEKDLVAGLLADGVNADQLIILTDVECVYKDFRTDKQEPIYMMTCAQAQQYLDAGEFGMGNMEPKIQTAIRFVGDSETRSVLITTLEKIREATLGQTGTVIKN
ncbi:MAG: carbamate kinase [Lachnospiraceae bacterium]|nr:carbamate kinase [Lachnospiraceae bacterium]